MKQRLGAVAVAALCLVAAIGRAQTVDLPPTLVTKVQAFTGPERTQIQQYVADRVNAWRSSDQAASKRGRQDLFKPLANPQVSVTFRLTYGEFLTQAVQQELSGGTPSRMIVALHLAGECATDRAAELIVQYLDHADESVRYSAAFGAGLTLRAVAAGSPAIQPDRTRELVNRLGARLAQEQNSFVLDRVIRSLDVAMGLSHPSVADLRQEAVRLISVRVGERLRSLDPQHNNVPLLQMLLRAGETVQDEFLTRGDLPAPIVVEAAGLGADAMVYVAKRFQAGIETDEERDLLIKIASTGENITFFARSAPSINPGAATPRPFNAAPRLVAGDQPGYLRLMDDLLRVLTQQPFSLDPSRFTR
ncbi:MAG: hypothetical protein H6811_04710 [Phycisphaeraceae bacterium]|nr:hypothetical protein [Phycisphaeraceae bacterium]